MQRVWPPYSGTGEFSGVGVGRGNEPRMPFTRARFNGGTPPPPEDRGIQCPVPTTDSGGMFALFFFPP